MTVFDVCSQGRPSRAELMLQVRVERGGKAAALCQMWRHMSFAAQEKTANSCPWKVHGGWEHCVLLTAKRGEVSCLSQPVLGIVSSYSSSQPPIVHSVMHIPSCAEPGSSGNMSCFNHSSIALFNLWCRDSCFQPLAEVPRWAWQHQAGVEAALAVLRRGWLSNSLCPVSRAHTRWVTSLVNLSLQNSGHCAGVTSD